MKNLSRIGITTLALAGALLGSLALAAPASASGTGTTGGGASTICVEGAGSGVAVRVAETPAARTTATIQNLVTGDNGCVAFKSSGIQTTSVTATALGRTGTASFAPTVAAGLIWTDHVTESGKVDAPERNIQHKYVQADRQGFSLTITR